MDWATGIQSAINYVEDNLTEEIDYREVAKKAACSSFYFQRIFGVLCGLSLGDYVRNRRLTLAGNELCTSDCKVIDIALKYGYESPESFTRAFSKFHGITPSEAKRDGSKLKSFSRISVKLTLCGGSVMNYKIVKKESFDVIEKAKLQNEEDANKSIPEFWSKSHRDGTVKKLLELTADPEFIFGICYGNTREDEKRFVYSIGAPIAENTPVPDGFRRNTVPARTWIVFECKGAMPNAIQELWRRIVSEFFPASGYTPTLEMDIEAYSNGDMSDPDYHSEIWLPIENK